MRTAQRKLSLWVGLGVIVVSLTSQAATLGEPSIRLDRYTNLSPGAQNDQVDPLSVVLQFITFPASVHTVEEAIDFVLPRSGYQLADVSASDPSLPTLLAQPLPQVHRHFDSITLRELLQTLAGKSWVLVEDPVHRQLSFDLNDHYRGAPKK